MKTLLTLFVLLFSSSVLANNINLICIAYSVFDWQKYEAVNLDAPIEFTVQQRDIIAGDMFYFEVSDECRIYRLFVGTTLINGICFYESGTDYNSYNIEIDRNTGKMSNRWDHNGKYMHSLRGLCIKDERKF